jgi:hypothetical protein
MHTAHLVVTVVAVAYPAPALTGRVPKTADSPWTPLWFRTRVLNSANRACRRRRRTLPKPIVSDDGGLGCRRSTKSRVSQV